MSESPATPDPAADAALVAELRAPFLRGLDCFDAGDYHEAHEQIEEAWSGEVGARRHLLQALIQLAVALHHRERGNFGGALSLCERAQEHLGAVASETCFIDPAALRVSVAAIEREIVLQRGCESPRFERALIPDFGELRRRVRAERAARGLGEPPG